MHISSNSVVLRKAGPADLEPLYKVEESAFPDAAWPKDMFTQALHDPANEVTMAELQGRAVGYILLDKGTKGPDTTRVNSLGVDPGCRGQKVGEQLFLWAMERSQDLGAKQVELEVEVGNTAAEKLYEKYGFVPTGIKPSYYGPGRDGREMTLADLQSRTAELRERREQLAAKLSGFPSQRWTTG
jgi:[ribosomal protein S18]-alanine N-acetyltransferase